MIFPRVLSLNSCLFLFLSKVVDDLVRRRRPLPRRQVERVLRREVLAARRAARADGRHRRLQRRGVVGRQLSVLHVGDGDGAWEVLPLDPGWQGGVELDDVRGDLLVGREAQQVLEVTDVLDGKSETTDT